MAAYPEKLRPLICGRRAYPENLQREKAA